MIGQKIEWMRKNPRVCVEVDEIAGKDKWTTVPGLRAATRKPERSPEGRRRRENARNGCFQARQEWWLPGAGKVPSSKHHEMVVYQIEIDRMGVNPAAHPAELIRENLCRHALLPFRSPSPEGSL